MKEELKKIILESIKSIETKKKGKIDPDCALFNEIWHELFINLKEVLKDLRNEGLIIEFDTINQTGYKTKKS